MGNEEYIKTSLLVVASIFTGFGGSYLAIPDNFYKGVICLLIAVGILALRGYLKKHGMEAKNVEEVEKKEIL